MVFVKLWDEDEVKHSGAKLKLGTWCNDSRGISLENHI